MMLLIKPFLISFVILICLSVRASYKTYEADVAESNWLFSGTPLACQLTHQVPFYGRAMFSKTAGKERPLVFVLSYKRQPIRSVRVASVYSFSPAWLPKQRPRELGEIAIQQGMNIFQSANTASWKLLNELEVGRFPTFRYQEFESMQDKVAVSLSAVGFKQPYDEFLNCLAGLVPYQLDELAKMTLRFDFDKSSVRKTYQKKLKALAAYIRFSPDLEVVFIHGYTDSKGSRGYNQQLSEKRVAAVQQLLTLEGTDESRFKTLAFGEKNPVASNRNPKGRSLNRRVYIRVN